MSRSTHPRKASTRASLVISAVCALGFLSHSAYAGEVLILGDGDADATVQSILSGVGHNVTISPVIEHQYNGTNPAPDAFCAVVHLNGDTFNLGMPTAGQQALRNYVLNNAGGFIGMEWNAYEEAAESGSTMIDMPELILMIRNSGYSVGTRDYVLTTDGMSHPVTAGLPNSFPVTAGGNIGSCKTALGMQILATDINGDAVCAIEAGTGRVVNYSHAGNWGPATPFNDPNMAQLLIQSVNWACDNTCGNGVVDLNEQCDDGNVGNNDDCLDTCVLPTCGDGYAHDQGAATEECDDGNADNNDDCLDTCVLAWCGDGFTHDQGTGTEACDDANANNNDDCLDTCVLAGCGDGFVYNEGAGTEACDDGNASNGDDCLDDCTAAVCGDGFLNSEGVNVEACDDGTLNSDVAPDACRTTCQEAGCGDGVRDTGEPCDNGAANSDTAADACRTTCENPRCGDGVVDLVEACDDGAGNSDTELDACRNDCSLPVCGDGIVNTSAEACDEGGANGTSGTCTAECLVPTSGCDCRVGHAGGMSQGSLGGYALLFMLLGFAIIGYRRRSGY